MDPNPPGGLEEQVNELRSRVRRLEEALLSSGIVLQKEKAPAEQANASPVSSPVSPSRSRVSE